MRLTARSEYGLLALVDIGSRHGAGPVSARGIAERQGIPLKFLEQLLAAMRKGGIVCAVRGAHGGFTLARPPAEITVLDIVEALEGPLAPTTCDGGQLCGRGGVCAAATVWGAATKALRDVFVGTTLADLASVQDSLDTTAIGR
jgi:Rrf2 family transcriptional regulator, cysteine metabolism repressor